MAVLLEDHPLAKKEIIYWSDLRGERLLLSRRAPGPELQDIIIARLTTPSDRPKIVLHDVSHGSLLNLVGAVFGITSLIEATVGDDMIGVVCREVRDTAEPARTGYSVHWRPDNENPALKSFIGLLAERYPLPATG